MLVLGEDGTDRARVQVIFKIVLVRDREDLIRARPATRVLAIARSHRAGRTALAHPRIDLADWMALYQVICVLKLPGSERRQHEDWVHGGKVVVAVRRRPISLQLAEKRVERLDADVRLGGAEVGKPEREQADCEQRVGESPIRYCRVTANGFSSVPFPEASLS